MTHKLPTLTELDRTIDGPAHRVLRIAMRGVADAVQDLDEEGNPLTLAPVHREKILAACAKLPARVPLELLAVLTRFGGLMIGGLDDDDGGTTDVFDVEELVDVNVAQRSLLAKIPEGVAFASDGGDLFYVLEKEGGRVLALDRGSSRTEVAGKTLAEFLEKISLGDDEEEGGE